jgi:hypothetical protein
MNDDDSRPGSIVLIALRSKMNKTMICNKRRINSDDFTNLGFDPTIDATQCQAQQRKDKNDLYYGVMFLDNHLIVNGDFNNLPIDGTIRVNRKDTDFTIVLPQSDLVNCRSRRNCRIYRSR